VLNSLRDLVYTPCCRSCQKIGSHVCSTCLTQLNLISRRDIPNVTLAVSASSYTGWVRDAVIDLKEGRRNSQLALGSVLARLISELAIENLCMVPVPSSPAKLRARGFNPVREVMKSADQSVASRLGISDLLGLTREPVESVGLSRRDRWRNVEGIFVALRPVPPIVVVVDDVITTGSTLRAAAQALKHGGAQEVFALALCGSGN